MAHTEEIFDLSASPELLRLAQEIQASGRSIALQHNGEVLAVLRPTRHRARRPIKLKPRDLSPHDIEEFLSAAGSWADVDVDAFLKDVYAARDVPEDRPEVR